MYKIENQQREHRFFLPSCQLGALTDGRPAAPFLPRGTVTCRNVDSPQSGLVNYYYSGSFSNASLCYNVFTNKPRRKLP